VDRETPRHLPIAPIAPIARVHLALVAVQASFAGFHVVAKWVLRDLAPLELAGLRVLLATPILLLYAWRHDRLRPALRDWPALALLGLLGVFANQILFIEGLQRTTATSAAILMPSVPVFAAALGALSGVERVGGGRLLGILLAVAGALVLLDPSRLSLGAPSARGNLLILGNCLAYAAFLVLQRPLLRRLPWRTVIAWAFLFGGLGVLGVAGPSLAARDLATVPAAVWLGVAYIVVLGSVVGYALNTWALRRSSPTVAASYNTLQPLLTALLAAAFLGERFGGREAAGMVLILAGLLLVAPPRRVSP
jgi:drug/metabolite transporter (DMT)-like permease